MDIAVPFLRHVDDGGFHTMCYTTLVLACYLRVAWDLDAAVWYTERCHAFDV